MASSTLLFLDMISAALFVLVGAFFLRVYRDSKSNLDLLVSVGFALVGVSYLTTTASEFQLATTDAWDYPRLAGQLGGTFVIAIAYSGHRSARRANAFWLLGWIVALVALVFGLLFVVRLAGLLPSVRWMFPWAHGAMALSWLYVAANASRAWSKRPTIESVLAPSAFACLAISKYTWVIIDLGNDPQLVPFVYAWRFLAVALLLAALFAPFQSPRGVKHAAS
jgi:hypothetical protein